MPGNSTLGAVETLITHTPRWTAQAMGYKRVWLDRSILKIDSENIEILWIVVNGFMLNCAIDHNADFHK
jgi:hypothetical protein